MCRTVWMKHVHHFVSVASIYLQVFVNHSWRKVRKAPEAQALIKEGAWDWSWVGEGSLGEHEFQGMVLAVHEYVSVQSRICGKWSHCIVCIHHPPLPRPPPLPSCVWSWFCKKNGKKWGRWEENGGWNFSSSVQRAPPELSPSHEPQPGWY